MRYLSLRRMGLMTVVWAGLLVALLCGVALAENIHCVNNGSIVCWGTSDSDDIEGGYGVDVIWALEGADVVDGDPDPEDDDNGGDDEIHGGPGNDTLRDTDGNDSDDVFGGRGNDRINVDDGDGNDEVDCGPGNRDVVVGYDKGERNDISNNCERVRR